MAKKKNEGGVNKSAEIRGYIATNPNAKPKEIVAALAEKGVVVSSAFVSTLKSNDARKVGTSSTRGRKVKGSVNGTEILVAAKKFADQVGGIDNARSALDTLAKILG